MMEECFRCGRQIQDGEATFLWHEKVTCGACNNILEEQDDDAAESLRRGIAVEAKTVRPGMSGLTSSPRIGVSNSKQVVTPGYHSVLVIATFCSVCGFLALFGGIVLLVMRLGDPRHNSGDLSIAIQAGVVGLGLMGLGGLLSCFRDSAMNSFKMLRELERLNR